MYGRQHSIDQFGRAWSNFNLKRKSPSEVDIGPQISATNAWNDRRRTNANGGPNSYQLNSRNPQFAARFEEKLSRKAASKSEHIDLSTLDGRVQNLLQQRNDKEAANRFSLSVPVHQASPNAYCFPFNSRKDHTVDCTAVSWNNNGQGTTDGYSKTVRHDLLSDSLSKKQQTAWPVASEQFASLEGIPCSSRFCDKSLHAGACDGGATFPGEMHSSYGASAQGHGHAQENLKCQGLQPVIPTEQSSVLCLNTERRSSTCSSSRVFASHPSGTRWVGRHNTEQNIHVELPSNQFYPLSPVASKGSAACFSSGVFAASDQSHPSGTQQFVRQVQRPGPQIHVSNWSISGESEVIPLKKRQRIRAGFVPSSTEYDIPHGRNLPKLQFYPQSPASIDSQYPVVQSITKDIGLYPSDSVVPKNPVEDGLELNHKNALSPLEEIFGTSNMVIMDDQTFAELNPKNAVSPLEEIFGTSNMVIMDDQTLAELNPTNAVSPLDEIFGMPSMEGIMDDSMGEILAELNHKNALPPLEENFGKFDMDIVDDTLGLLKEPTLGCRDGEQIMEDASKLNLETVYSTAEKVTVAPNMGNVELEEQKLEVDDALVDSSGLRYGRVPFLFEELNGHLEERQSTVLADKVFESECALSEGIHNEVPEVPISGVRRTTAVSLIEYFTRGQIEEHLSGLKKLSSQILLGDKETDTADTQSEKPCELCGETELLFAPASMYCSNCYKTIKVGSDYYTSNEESEELLDGEGKKYFCSRRCGRNPKLVKKTHDERRAEPWVQCDSCGAWHHQICGLYNNKKDTAENAEYICPICCLKFIDDHGRATFRDGCTISAKDLPRTMLSDHIEQRLYGRLKQEREDRAKASGKKIHEVATAEDLVVRVVSSITANVEVNKQFLDIFRVVNYPSELPYKSKVIALFQNIEGVDVFLFGMYVQEYGTDCSHPNKRSIYISYLDSVKYFHPDIKSAYEESLRSFVYHEILIGYLECCKERGFASCYLWVCPPVKGDDYLFHCHPEFQKNLPRKKLLKWYQKIFSRAADEEIVLSSTNLYKQHFVPSKGHMFSITAARLPYFEGDYWPSKLEKFLGEINQKPVEELEQKDKRMPKRASKNKRAPKRALKGCKSLSADSTTDILLMQKIEQSMQDKNEFMVAHLQHICTCCQEVILSGNRWFCDLCKNFQLCQRCVDLKEADTTSKDPPVCREKHLLSQEAVDSVSEDTEDDDMAINNPLFEKRRNFLEFCKINNYQFDTLRRAKHSSMMILYHLSERMDQLTGTACSLCHGEMSGSGRMCKICLDFHVCKACYTQQDFSHSHELTPASSADDPPPDIQFKWLGSINTKDILSLLVHCSQCNASQSRPCPYLYCPRIKGLFRHSTCCFLGGASEGCKYCRNVWLVLQLHAKDCRALDCGVPWCRQLKGRLSMKPVKSERDDGGIHQAPISA